MPKINDKDFNDILHEIVQLETMLKAIELKLVKRFEGIRQKLLLAINDKNDN